MRRLWRWHQDYVESHPHISSWIGVAEGVGRLHDLMADIVRNAVPYTAGAAGAIFKASFAKGLVSVIPPVERRVRNAQLIQGPLDR